MHKAYLYLITLSSFLDTPYVIDFFTLLNAHFFSTLKIIVHYCTGYLPFIILFLWFVINIFMGWSGFVIQVWHYCWCCTWSQMGAWERIQKLEGGGWNWQRNRCSKNFRRRIKAPPQVPWYIKNCDWSRITGDSFNHFGPCPIYVPFSLYILFLKWK